LRQTVADLMPVPVRHPAAYSRGLCKPCVAGIVRIRAECSHHRRPSALCNTIRKKLSTGLFTLSSPASVAEIRAAIKRSVGVGPSVTHSNTEVEVVHRSKSADSSRPSSSSPRRRLWLILVWTHVGSRGGDGRLHDCHGRSMSSMHGWLCYLATRIVIRGRKTRRAQIAFRPKLRSRFRNEMRGPADSGRNPTVVSEPRCPPSSIASMPQHL
jgi:hypothetical protein